MGNDVGRLLGGQQDLHGEIIKAIFRVDKGDTLEWDVATESERDQMREVARRIEPVIRATCDQMSEWLATTASRRIVISSGWRWKFLFRVDEEAYRVCVLGVLVEVVRQRRETL